MSNAGDLFDELFEQFFNAQPNAFLPEDFASHFNQIPFNESFSTINNHNQSIKKDANYWKRKFFKPKYFLEKKPDTGRIVSEKPSFYQQQHPSSTIRRGDNPMKSQSFFQQITITQRNNEEPEIFHTETRDV
ncbi:hypothetical protein SNEBB_005856 [Seison nebaliae]|nr:hypothetical protein SNEBB_005856 [Seison nebaliae]